MAWSEGGEVWQQPGGSAMPAGSFLKSRVTADLWGWFICTHDINTIAVLVIPDIFLLATLFIHKDWIYVQTTQALRLFSRTVSEKRVLLK